MTVTTTTTTLTTTLTTTFAACREAGITESRGILSVYRMVQSGGRTLDDAIAAELTHGPVLPTAPVESPYRPVSFVAEYGTYIIFPRPEILGRWQAVFTLANGDTKDCGHTHSREDLAAKCGRRSMRLGNTWQ